MTILEFERPRDITPPGLDGKVIRFFFSMVRQGKGAYRDRNFAHWIDVTISGTLRSMWGYGRAGDLHPNLVKIMFYYAKEEIVNKLENGIIKDQYDKIDLHTGNQPNICPLDPLKIPVVIGHRVELNIDLYTYPDRKRVKKTDQTGPTVFISYSWDNEDHKNWVLGLAERLKSAGISLIFDQWDLELGDNLPEFMERIRGCDYVLIICTERYKEKADQRKGGVGYEESIMTAEVLQKVNHRKFIPVLRGAEWTTCAPTWASGKLYCDLRGEPFSEEEYNKLLNTLRKRQVS